MSCIKAFAPAHSAIALLYKRVKDLPDLKHLVPDPERVPEKLFGGRSVACDFVDLVQKAFGTRLVAPLQGSLGRLFATSPTVSRLNINPPNSF
jgi:hypothetical protein